MSRVLVTGGAGTIGQAVVRRLLRDPDWELRVSDQRPAPDWIREGCEVHTGDLRDRDEAARALDGCSHVIHLAAIVGGIANFHKLPYTLTDVNSSLYNAIVGAAVERGSSASSTSPRRWSSSARRSSRRPRTTSGSARSRARPTASASSPGEFWVRAAHDEHGLPYTICRPFNAYGPGEMPEDEPGIAHAVPDLIKKCIALGSDDEPLPIFGDGTHTRTLTHVDDIADGIVTAMASGAASARTSTSRRRRS